MDNDKEEKVNRNLPPLEVAKARIALSLLRYKALVAKAETLREGNDGHVHIDA